MEYILENFPQIIVCFVICFAKIIEISIQSVKTVFMVKGERVIAAVLAFIECLIWGLVISSIITSLGNNFYLLISYCMGYALGLFIGSMIENKIALGTSSVQIMVKREYEEEVEKFLMLNNRGFTILEGKGSKEKMSVIIMILPRKEVKSIMMEIKKICNNEVFVVTSEVSKFVGGYGIRK